MKIYVLNLERSRDRWVNISVQLDQLGLDYKRVPAVDGRELILEDVADNAACIRHMGRALQPGEAGCYLSHLCALETFLATEDEYAVILEDDVLLEDSFVEDLSLVLDNMRRLPAKEYSAVNLGPSDHKYSSVIREGQRFSLLAAHRFPMSAMGILWSRRGAKQVLEYDTIIKMPYDNFLRSHFSGTFEGYSVYPKLVKSESIDSDINAANTTAKRSALNRSRFYFFINLRRSIAEKARAFSAMVRWRYFNSAKL